MILRRRAPPAMPAATRYYATVAARQRKQRTPAQQEARNGLREVALSASR